MSFVSFRMHVPVEPNEQERQKSKIFLSLYPVPFVLEGLIELIEEKIIQKWNSTHASLLHLPPSRCSKSRLVVKVHQQYVLR